MAHPSFAVEQAVSNFWHLWNCGLEPSLTFKTLSNGAIVVHSTIQSFPVPFKDCFNVIRNRSGRNARLRQQKCRRNARSFNSTSQDQSNLIEDSITALEVSDVI